MLCQTSLLLKSRTQEGKKNTIEETGNGVWKWEDANVEQWHGELVVVPHPSASWMLTLTRFAAPRSSASTDTVSERERERAKEGKNKKTVQMDSSYSAMPVLTWVNHVFFPCAFLSLHSLQVDSTDTLTSVRPREQATAPSLQQH